MATAYEKSAARQAVARALKAGRITRPAACESCGSAPPAAVVRSRGHLRSAILLHHWDYSRPLDVIPLCNRCHREVHCGIRPEPRTGRMYPREAHAEAVRAGFALRREMDEDRRQERARAREAAARIACMQAVAGYAPEFDPDDTATSLPVSDLQHEAA